MSDMVKTFYGFCPTQNMDFSVDVGYAAVESFEHPTYYLRTMSSCDYASFVGNDCPIMKTCPIRAQAPEKIF